MQSVVNNKGISKERDINTTLLNGLGINNDNVKHINYYLNKDEQEQESTLKLAKEKKIIEKFQLL